MKPVFTHNSTHTAQTISLWFSMEMAPYWHPEEVSRHYRYFSSNRGSLNNMNDVCATFHNTSLTPGCIYRRATCNACRTDIVCCYQNTKWPRNESCKYAVISPVEGVPRNGGGIPANAVGGGKNAAANWAPLGNAAGRSDGAPGFRTITVGAEFIACRALPIGSYAGCNTAITSSDIQRICIRSTATLNAGAL